MHSKPCLSFVYKIVLNQEIIHTMKTKLFTFALLFCSVVLRAQNENKFTGFINDRHGENIRTETQTQNENHKKLYPVYFNYRKRLLRYNGTDEISGAEFLHLCRTINDSAIQLQVARYDAFTNQKAKLGIIALGGGLSSIALFVGTAASTGAGNDMVTGSLAFFGVVGILMIPASAIYSAVPHQKRKAVLFRDLPVAYNQYVETHQ